MNKNNNFDPFENLMLDEYEQGIEDAAEKGELVRVKNYKKEEKMWKEMAKRYFELKKSKSVTLRIKSASLLKVKVKAQKNNIPYQTLINLLIDNYVEGKTRLEL
jgi:predicted DNA binding CopG/RHH family protein